MASVLTQDDLLDVVDRQIPDSYLEPIKEVGPGYEVWHGMAKIGERCSVAVANFERDIYILTSAGGVLATVEATFYRPSFVAGAGVMLAGTLVRASRGGQVFRTVVDAAFGPTDLEVVALAIAVGYGYEWNIQGPFVDPDGATWPGELDTIDLPLQNPVFWDTTIQVRNDNAADGLGRPQTLDILGAERALGRLPSEDDTNYSIRIRQLPDTVSPAAIRRQLTNFFRRFPGITWSLIETWQHEYQECYDAPDLGPTAVENFDKDLFCYDDPRAATPIRNRYLGNADYMGAFIVEVSNPPAILDYGIAYDDPAADDVGPPSSLATRALPAFDVAEPLAPPALAPAYDGVDFGIDRLFSELFNLLDEIKAAGVFVVIHFQEL